MGLGDIIMYLITGASGGIGKLLFDRFTSEGKLCFGTYYSSENNNADEEVGEALDKAGSLLQKGQKALAITFLTFGLSLFGCACCFGTYLINILRKYANLEIK